MVAPYLRGLSNEGGTLYVFPSVSCDLTKTFVSNDYEFKFSHFACLNIPDIYSGQFSEDNSQKGLYLETFRSSGSSPVDWSSDGMGNALAENFQNYIMNFETAILNGEGDNDDYDNDILTTVSEKVFWNWMQKVGAIKFTETGTEEDYNTYDERTVQYIGNLDVTNTVEINGDVFEEIYIHIPSTVGASTSVYFRSGDATDNKNYLDKQYIIGGSDNNIIGRNDTQHPYDPQIGIKPFFDIDEGNIYTGDKGYTIDFRDTSYGDGISTMNSNSLEDFQFNAVLIYYDLYKKTNTPGVKSVATNLYGILFLNQVTDQTGGTASDNSIQGYIERLPKKKETVYGNGNSFALKLDLKIDTIPDSSYTNVKYDDPNSAYSMTLYEKAILQLQKCIDLFYTQKNEIAKLNQRVENLENIVMGIDTITSMKEDITRLYNLYQGNAVIDTSTIIGLIEDNTNKLNNILNGGKDLKLQYDTDVLQPGIGIGLTKTPNRVVINSEHSYYINEVMSGEEIISSDNPLKSNELKECSINLKPGENLAVIYISDTGDSKTNLIINIDSSEVGWRVGQSFKLCFRGDVLQFEDSVNNGLIINLENNNTLSITGGEFEGNDLIEIICVEEGKYIYLIK